MDDAEADVQPALHAARVGLDVAIGGVHEVEPVEDFGRASLGGSRASMPYSRPWMTSSPRPVSDGSVEPPCGT